MIARWPLRRRATTIAAGAVASLAISAHTALAETSRPADAGDGATTRASAELSSYVDTDHVTVVSPTVSLGMEDPVRGWSASGRYLVDVVSAASADIVATASPRWRETRHAGTFEGSYKPHDFGLAPRSRASRTHGSTTHVRERRSSAAGAPLADRRRSRERRSSHALVDALSPRERC